MNQVHFYAKVVYNHYHAIKNTGKGMNLFLFVQSPIVRYSGAFNKFPDFFVQAFKIVVDY